MLSRAIGCVIWLAGQQPFFPDWRGPIEPFEFLFEKNKYKCFFPATYQYWTLLHSRRAIRPVVLMKAEIFLSIICCPAASTAALNEGQALSGPLLCHIMHLSSIERTKVFPFLRGFGRVSCLPGPKERFLMHQDLPYHQGTHVLQPSSAKSPDVP